MDYTNQSTPEQWLGRLNDPAFQSHLQVSCGYSPHDWTSRARVWRIALEGFLGRFGSRPVSVSRCPGRVNPRGMHVDTHGGFLNVMTHQRETLVVAAPSGNGSCTFANADPAFAEFSFRPDDEPEPAALSWERFIETDAVQAHTQSLAGSWGLYIRGCAQSLRARTGAPVHGIDAFVASDLPRGSALSASHALCVATVFAFEHVNALSLPPQEQILAARDAEWYAGARTGTSDQSAMILGEAGTMLSGPLPPADLDLTRLRKIPWPAHVSLVVIQSFTARNLSGAERLAYTANRFAYSLALDILRDVLGSEHGSDRHLCEITESRFGNKQLLRALRMIPERLSMHALRQRCHPEAFESAYLRYFGNLDEIDIPSNVPLRGPLLFAIAESERARIFARHMEEGRFDQAGALMIAGHDGDRRLAPDGTRFVSAVDDAALLQWEESNRPIHMIPGSYGASSPALDAIVDEALAAGAYGASLTGAGIAGVVLALCPKAGTEELMTRLGRFLASDSYATRASLSEPIPPARAVAGVVVNRAPAGASVIV